MLMGTHRIHRVTQKSVVGRVLDPQQPVVTTKFPSVQRRKVSSRMCSVQCYRLKMELMTKLFH